MTPEEREAGEKAHWVFDKKVNVGHLVMTASLAVAIFSWGGAMDRRVAVLEEKARAQAERDLRQDAELTAGIIAVRSDLTDIRTALRETNSQLTRLVERGSVRP